MRPLARPVAASRATARGRRAGPSGFAIALGVSVALHLILLAVRFVMPQASLFKPPDSPLEVILVNARSADKPIKPDAIAQFDLNGGGEHDDRSRDVVPAAHGRTSPTARCSRSRRARSSGSRRSSGA